MKTLLVDHRPDGIVTITINRPQLHNALDLATMRGFERLMNDLLLDDSVRVVILTGAGEQAFCSGADLNELRFHPSLEDGHAMIALMGDALLKLEQLAVPVIAAVNGYALGGGSEVALACDLRIVDTTARLGLVQVRMALTPGWGGGQRLARLVGYAKAMELLLTGATLDAPEQSSLGLANRVVPAGTALHAATEWAQDIADLPMDVIRGIKTLLQASRQETYQQALETERRIFPTLWASSEHQQAVAAFFRRNQQE